ncbi:hypothetical protein CAPTEDRAFT_222089 [Capitella teleta]|uniref:K Homology domain-containing protein n=1 Tax=Capitella teleta TaxID=283909 RepID=R7TEF3_CAPTE|nr:hypothetical protein CAPTEDRAFT_222089 [Capitella teleta]|eukprot:ELT91852.1 hypothetical protein CAPTEDRAFT_222089 [Capitella teleta]
MWHQNHSTGIFEFYVSIPVELAGKVMGKGGTHIKRLQQLSNTVISMNKADSDDEKELILRGRTEESVLEGVEILEHFLRTGQFLGEDQEEDAASSISRTSSVDSRPAPSPRRQSSPPSLTTSPPSLSVKSPPSSAQSPTPQPTQPTSPLPTPTKSLDLDDVFSEIKIEQLHIAGHLMSLHCENKALLREASAVLKAHFNQPKVATPKSPPLPSSCDRGVVVYNDLDFSEDLACETSGLQSSKQKGNISATDCPLPDDSWQQDDRLTSTPARSLSMPTASAGLEISSIPAARNNETTEAATLDRAHLSRSLMADSSSVEKLRSCRSRGFGAGGRLGLFGYIQPTNITRDPLCPLSSRSEICQAESEDCSQGSLSVSERRKQFAVCTNKKNSREGSETKDERLVYAPSFLLACSRSPFARSPPKNWAEFSGSVPEICLDKMSDDFKLPRLRSVSMSANVTSDIFLSEPGNKGSRPNSISLDTPTSQVVGCSVVLGCRRGGRCRSLFWWLHRDASCSACSHYLALYAAEFIDVLRDKIKVISEANARVFSGVKNDGKVDIPHHRAAAAALHHSDVQGSICLVLRTGSFSYVFGKAFPVCSMVHPESSFGALMDRDVIWDLDANGPIRLLMSYTLEGMLIKVAQCGNAQVGCVSAKFWQSFADIVFYSGASGRVVYACYQDTLAFKGNGF